MNEVAVSDDCEEGQGCFGRKLLPITGTGLSTEGITSEAVDREEKKSDKQLHLDLRVLT